MEKEELYIVDYGTRPIQDMYVCTKAEAVEHLLHLARCEVTVRSVRVVLGTDPSPELTTVYEKERERIEAKRRLKQEFNEAIIVSREKAKLAELLEKYGVPNDED